MTKENHIKVTQVKSSSKLSKAKKSCLLGLGLRKIGQVVTVEGTKDNLGMVNSLEQVVKIVN